MLPVLLESYDGAFGEYADVLAALASGDDFSKLAKDLVRDKYDDDRSH